MPDEIAERLRDAYGFEEVTVGERLEGGYANDLLRVRGDDAIYVLRIKHPPIDEDDIAWEHRLVRWLSERLSVVVAPVDGGKLVRVGDRVGWLLPFIEGVPVDPGCEAHRLAAARGLGRLHRVGKDLAVAPRPRLRPLAELDWPPALVVPELQEWAARIADTRTWAISFVESIARERRLPVSVVHGDYFPGNVLVAGGELAGIVDWEESQVDWVTWDLASSLGAFCSAGDELDRGACQRFLAVYRAAGGTARALDHDLLVPLIRVKRILEVLRAPTDREPRWDHQRHNLRSLEPLARARML
jgi:Ser/Thr protein kinase RdoA (MazF antagonist)